MEQYHVIGETAGKIYQSLQKSAKTVAKLQKDTAVSDNALFHQAIGWLARESKIKFCKEGRSVTLTL
jgi:hypothetical protein